MKKILVVLFVLLLSLGLFNYNTADAAKKGGKKGGINAEEMTKINSSIDEFTRKIYANSLFAPTDMNQIIEIKLKMDSQMMLEPMPELAPLYFKLGNIYKARECQNEAIECYQTILENFSDTAFAPKAMKVLKIMGIKVEGSAETLIENSSHLNELEKLNTDDVKVIKFS